MYGDKDYSYFKEYNHRSILLPEIVIEFDTEDKMLNYFYANQIAEMYKERKIKYSMWTSGNKSVHLHTLVDIKCSDIGNLKKAWLQYFCKGLDEQPDYRLCSDAHLIRAENGVHEKTGQKKSLLYESKGYRDSLEIIPQDVWDTYMSNKRKSISIRINNAARDVTEHPGIKYILKSEDFRSTNDGRERCLFMLIHVLKSKFEKDKLVKYLQEWYRYSGGYQLDDEAVKRKVLYQLTREYNIGHNYINNILKELKLEKYCVQ